MYRILYNPEILDNVFSYNSRHTNTVAARVCRVWFTRSIRFIWDTVKLNDALTILSPFVIANGSVSFQQPLFPHSWQRFFLYSKHVRYLQCFDIRYTAMTQLALWRPCIELFSSKLVAIHWKGLGKDIECLPHLLTSALQLLHISLDVIDNPDIVDALFKTIATRSPSLRIFQISVPSTNNHRRASRSIGELMSLLLGLVSVAISMQFMTSELFAILSCLPKLNNLLLYPSSFDQSIIRYAEQFIQHNITTQEEEVITSNSSLFHSLEVLGIMDKVNNPSFTIAKALGHGVPLLKLVNLTCSPCCETSNQFILLMESVHMVCPNLREMVVSSCSLPRLPCKAILALLQCPHLHTLKASVTIAGLELEHIITIVANRSFWKNIGLYPEKPLSCQPALIAFARGCPKLVELGLTLTYDMNFPDQNFEDGRFGSLATLNVGYSVIDSQIEVGIFLARICGNPLKIMASGKHAMSWKAVEKMVNFINTTAHVRTLNEKINLLEQKRTFNSISIQTVEEVIHLTQSRDPDVKPFLVKTEKHSQVESLNESSIFRIVRVLPRCFQTEFKVQV